MRKRWDELLDRIPKGAAWIGAEVGVWRGTTCHRLLRSRPELVMFLVDWWLEQGPESTYFKSGDTKGGRPQVFFDQCYEATLRAVERFKARTYIMRMDSVEAAGMLQNGFLDFVFIDGDHSYEGVLRDLIAWAPKVRKGGFIGGHDLDNDRFKHWGVRRALEEYWGDRMADLEMGEDHTWFLPMK